MAGIGMHEQDWEEHALEVLAEYGWETLRGPAVAPGSGQRASWEDPVLDGTLSSALRTLNPTVPPEYLDQAAAEVLTPTSQDAIAGSGSVRHHTGGHLLRPGLRQGVAHH